MSSSLWSADRNTHLKIVLVSLICSIVVVAVGLNARVADRGDATARIIADDIPVVAGKAKIYTDGARSTIR